MQSNQFGDVVTYLQRTSETHHKWNINEAVDPRELKQYALPEIKLLNILANCHFSDH